MSDLLTQDEIDALLHGVDEVEEEDVELGAAPGVTTFDFSSQDRIVRGRMALPPEKFLISDAVIGALFET